MGHENGEPRFVGCPVDEDAGHEAAEVAEQREDREDGQKDPVDVRPQQSIAGRQLVERREAVAEGKVVGQRGRAAELVVVSEERLQLVQSFKHVAGEGGHGTTSQVQHSELGQTPEVVRLLHVTSGQVQHVQAGEGLEDRGAQLEYSDLGQVQVTQGPKGRRGRSRVIVEQGREGVSRQNQRPQAGHRPQVANGDVSNRVVAQVQAPEVGEGEVTHVLQPAAGQTEVNQHGVVREVELRHSRPAGIQEAEVWVAEGGEGPATRGGQSVARAVRGTGRAAVELVVLARALEDAVTHVLRVQTHGGGPAAVEPRTRGAGAARLVLTARTVVHTVTANVHRQAVTAPRTPEVGVWAKGCWVTSQSGKVDGSDLDPSATVQCDYGRGR